MDITKLKEILKDSGVAGAGGAGFPTYAKMSEKAEYVILNCAECEPLLRVHRQIIATYAEEIMKALSLVCEVLGAKEFIVAVKGAYKNAVDAVNRVLPDHEKGRLHLLKEIYPAGDEVILVYDTIKRVVPAGGLPLDVGAAVINVETALNIYRAVFEGKSVTHKYITVTGEVKNPKTVLAPIGTSFSDLIALCGGKTTEDTAIIHGGPMTGRLTDESGTVTKTSNAIIVLPKNHHIVGTRTQKVTISVTRAMGTCCQCRTCTDLCSRNLLNHPIDPAAFMRCISSGNTDVPALVNTLYCSGCGLCEMYSCPQGLSPAALIGIYKSKLRKNGLKPDPLPAPADAKEERDGRLVPMSRLISRLDIVKYDHDAPLDETEIKTAKVKISLAQSIGAPPVVAVKKGDTVKVGDVIAAAAENALSLPIHSSVNGTVTDVTEKSVTVKIN